MPDVPVYDLPSGGAFGYVATDDPEADSGTHELNTTGGGGSIVNSVVAGTNVTVDDTDPHNPIVSSSGGGGTALWDYAAPNLTPDPTNTPGFTAIQLSDATPQVRATLANDGSGLTLTDTTPADRVTLKDDGSGLTVFNSVGVPIVQVADGTGLVAFGGGGFNDRAVISNDGTDFGRVDLYDTATNPRATLAGDGSGLTLTDAAGNQRATINEIGATFDDTVDAAGKIVIDTQALAVQIKAPPDGTNTYAQLGIAFAGTTGFIELDQAGDSTSTQIYPGFLQLYNAAGAQIVNIGVDTVGLFAATPHAQEAFIDPTTITPEQIGQILIDFGFMAAS